MRNTNKKPPSRIKYEESHPIVSFRVPKETYIDLERMKAQTGLSLADIIKAAIDKQEIDLDLSYWGGYEDAEKMFRVNYRCYKCGKLLSIQTDEEKRDAAQFMTDNGWGHTQCPNTGS